MKRKIIAAVLALSMVGGMLAGCGKSEGEKSEQKEPSSNGAEQIIVTYLTMGETPEDLQMVQDAVNEISVPEINVEVQFKPIAISETFTNYSTWIASGEQMDLMMLCFQDPSSYVASGSLLPLDEYLEKDAPVIKTLGEEFPLYEGAVYNEEIYGINPVSACYGKSATIMLRKDYFDELGTELKEIYTYEDLNEVFAAIKEKHPDSYPLGVFGSDCSTSNSLYNRFHELDVLGAGVDTGVLMSADSKEIVNLFETDEYYKYLEQMKKWYDAGYIMQDAATTSSTMQELTEAGVVTTALVYPYEPTVQDAYDSGFGRYGGAVALPTTEVYLASNGASNGTYWTVPITSANPEAAMKFLNLTIENSEVLNLISWGIEDKHYLKTDNDRVIKYPEGKDITTNSYACTLGVWGDKREMYVTSEKNTRELNDSLTEQGMDNRTTASEVGYSYNSEKVASKVIAVDTVLQQYMPALETGSVSDLKSTYTEFISALKAAGIDDIIADNQAQFDAAIENALK